MNRHLVFVAFVVVWHFASMGRCPVRFLPFTLPLPLITSPP